MAESSDDFSDIDTPQHAGATPSGAGDGGGDFDDFDEMDNQTGPGSVEPPTASAAHPPDEHEAPEATEAAEAAAAEEAAEAAAQMQALSLNSQGMDIPEASPSNLNEMTPMSAMTDTSNISDGDMSPLNYGKHSRAHALLDESNTGATAGRAGGSSARGGGSTIGVTADGGMKRMTGQSGAGMDEIYYNPRDYDSLQVSNEIKRLFEYIEVYKPVNMELETQLKPFVPDYIPAIGNVDGFIKPARPDSKEEGLGLKSLDEPLLKQSDPSTLDLQLRSASKLTNMKFVKIRSIERADKNPSKISNWIQSINDMKSQKAGKDINNNMEFQNRPMPDLEELMQPWDSGMDQYLRQIMGDKGSQDDASAAGGVIPPYDMELSLEQYAAVLCSVFDIPVYSKENVIPSLHCLFSLYAMFKQQQSQTQNH